MRLYSFQNFYLAGIHAGIQTAHSIARMSQKYSMDEGFVNLADTHDVQAGVLFNDWAKRGGHETIIVKNGGMQCNLEETLKLFQSAEHCYPFDYFNEAQEALGGALTNVSIVVPTHIWQLADGFRRDESAYHSFDTEDGHTWYLVDQRDHSAAPFTTYFMSLVEQRFEKSGLPTLDFNNYKHQFDCPDVEPAFVRLDAFDKALIQQMNRCGLMS